jgi:hypothetical protein
MPTTIDLGDDDFGYVVFKYKGKDIQIDVLELCNKLQSLKSSFSSFQGIPNIDGGGEATTGDGLIEETRKLLEEYGFEGISQAKSTFIVAQLNKLTEDVKKNIGLNV